MIEKRPQSIVVSAETNQGGEREERYIDHSNVNRDLERHCGAAEEKQNVHLLYTLGDIENLRERQKYAIKSF